MNTPIRKGKGACGDQRKIPIYSTVRVKRTTIFSRYKFINIINIFPLSGEIKVELSITEATIQD